MRTALGVGFAGSVLVLSVSLIGGASLPGSGLRAAGAFLLFGVLGLLLHLLWQNLTPEAPVAAEPKASAAPTATAASAPAAAPARPATGAMLNQVLPAASPADLFEPLAPPVVTAKRMEE